MTLKHFMAAQMRKPSGWFGSVILRRLLNRMNMAVVDSTLSRIELEPHHHLLEIGFGGGALGSNALQQPRHPFSKRPGVADQTQHEMAFARKIVKMSGMHDDTHLSQDVDGQIFVRSKH